MGNGISVQNIAHNRQPHDSLHTTAHMGPSVYPRQNGVMLMHPQAYIQTRQVAPLVAREEHIHKIPTTLNTADGITNVTQQCSQGRPAPAVHPVPGVHPALKHTADAYKPSPIEGKHQVVYPVSRSQDSSMELPRDSLQSRDVELVCETLGPVTDTLNQRLPLK